MRRLAAALLALLVLLSALVLARPGRPGYAEQSREAIASGADAVHPAGTDALGRDRLARVAASVLIGLVGATAAAGLTTLIAALVGTSAAFAPSPLASLLLLATDAFLALPWLFLLMLVRSGIPLTASPLTSATITFLLLGLLGWPACARAVHSGARAIRHADWMTQARASGVSSWRLARRHVLPHLLPLLVPQFLISVPACLVAEANLGTLGLGVQEPLPSWGSMLLELDNSATLASTHWVYLPLILLVTLLLFFELMAVEA